MLGGRNVVRFEDPHRNLTRTDFCIREHLPT